MCCSLSGILDSAYSAVDWFAVDIPRPPLRKLLYVLPVTCEEQFSCLHYLYYSNPWDTRIVPVFPQVTGVGFAFVE